MRSPKPAFDLSAALSLEVTAAAAETQGAPFDAGAIHRCRVHLKRARALARIGAASAPGLAAVFNQSARAVMRELAASRDPVALAATARGMVRRAGRKSYLAFQTIAERLEQEQAPAPDLSIIRANLKDLLALANVWPEASARQIYRGAKRIARRARKAYRRGRKCAQAAHRHTWRKREKEQLYAVGLLGEAWPSARREKLSRRLGEILGKERDVLLLIERLSSDILIADEPDRAHALKTLEKRRARLAARADALGARLHRGNA